MVKSESQESEYLDEIESSLDSVEKIESSYKLERKMSLNLFEGKKFQNLSKLIIYSKIKELESEKENQSMINASKKILDPLLNQNNFYTIKKEKENSAKIMKEKIEDIFKDIKKILPDHLVNIVFYIVGKLVDNIDQHSDFSSATVLFNYNKESNFVEIGVLDNGRSIPGAFELKNVVFKEDFHSIKLAISGTSTKEEKGRGTGLPSSKKLTVNGLNGNFLVVSRNGFVLAKDNIEITEKINKSLNGTLVYIKFKDAQKALNIYEYLN